MRMLSKTGGLLAVIAAVALSLCAVPLTAHAANDVPAGKAAPATAIAQQGQSTYRVAFKANGGEGSMKAQAVKRGKKAALRANGFTRAGYKFAGWNTRKDGKGKSYRNKAKVKNLAKAGKTVKLYAQWKKSSNSSFVVSTPYYRVTVPKAWRGKVQWVTTSRYDSEQFKVYNTAFFLKGHKNDQKYWLATIGGERSDRDGITSFDEYKTTIVSTTWKGESFVYLVASNMPYIIAQDRYSTVGAAAKPLIPDSVSDRERMLELVVGNTMAYEQATKLSLYDGSVASAYEYVRDYLWLLFRNALKAE